MKKTLAIMAATFFVILIVEKSCTGQSELNTASSAIPDAVQSSAPTDMPDSPPPPEPPPEPVRNTLKMNADALYKGYAANEVAMNRKIGDSIVEVTGTLKSIDEMLGDVVLRLIVGDRDSFESVGLTLKNPDREEIARLQKGQRVVVQCLKMQRGVMDNPLGSDCTLLHVSAAPPVTQEQQEPDPPQ